MARDSALRSRREFQTLSLQIRRPRNRTQHARYSLSLGDSREKLLALANLRKLISPQADGGAQKANIIIDGQSVPVSFRRNGRARRIIMRIDRRGDGITLTLPPGVGRNAAMNFAISHASWIRTHLKKRIDRVPFIDGAFVPVRGQLHLIEHYPADRGTVWIEERGGELSPTLCVAGEAPHMARRIRDWLKKQAREDLTAACTRYSEAMELSYKRLSVRDQTSRWGSCSSSRSLSFSWRLILAPAEVLDYVAAHEVAHLREMNHSARFWKLVEDHCMHAKSSRQWLKENGAQLHRYGQ